MNRNIVLFRCAALAAGLLVCFAPSEVLAAKKWRPPYTGCALIPNSANDGDSFHVKAASIKTRTYLFRLYFVDTPESDGSLPERLQVQADYWGMSDIKDVIKMGKEATAFTAKLLGDNNFTVYSKLADAMGRSEKDRDYAMVMSSSGQDLGVELVRNGLARVFGNGADLSELDAYKRDEAAWWKRLRQAELEAKKAGLGCWAYASAAPSRLDAMSAPRQISERDVVLTRPVYLYPLDAPNGVPLGQLREGVTVRVLKGATPDKAQVRFTTSSGQVIEGLARFVDLGL